MAADVAANCAASDLDSVNLLESCAASTDESCFICSNSADSTESGGAGFDGWGTSSVASAVGEEFAWRGGS